MLLVKYDKFETVSKDDYVEELLYKYEKNVLHLQSFESKGRQVLDQMVECLDDADSVINAMEELSEEYKKLQDIEGKLRLLKANQSFVFTTFTGALNKKLNSSDAKVKGLKEVYRIQVEIARLNVEFEGDVTNKIKVIEKCLPEVIFQGGGTTASLEENLRLMIDLWTYSNQVSLK